jgi:hypothetical protein
VPVSAVTPFLMTTSNNPASVDHSRFDQTIDRLKKDRQRRSAGLRSPLMPLA